MKEEEPDYLANLFLFCALVCFILCVITIDWKADIPKDETEQTEVITEAVTPTEEQTKQNTQTDAPTETPTVTPIPTPIPTEIPATIKTVEHGHKFKPYTGYWAYNVRTSQQWKLQQIASTDERTGIRYVIDPNGERRYCVALGGYWCGYHPEHIGRCVDVVMANGSILKCVLADVKRTEDTKGRANRYGEINNDILEFIVQEKFIPYEVWYTGNVSKAGAEFEGDVDRMIVYDMWIEGFGKEIR